MGVWGLKPEWKGVILAEGLYGVSERMWNWVSCGICRLCTVTAISRDCVCYWFTWATTFPHFVFQLIIPILHYPFSMIISILHHLFSPSCVPTNDIHPTSPVFPILCSDLYPSYMTSFPHLVFRLMMSILHHLFSPLCVPTDNIHPTSPVFPILCSD
jgi:hypothetical protein